MWCLGTAQLGLDAYGVNNALPADKSRAFEVLRAAYDCGVRWIDTAAAYGQAEEWIAEWAPDDVCVVTKNTSGMYRATPTWHTLYHGDDLPHKWRPCYDGASVYTLQAADEVLRWGSMMLQVPLNIHQTGFLTSGIIHKALANNVTVFVRSVFANGYLLNHGHCIESCINFVRNAAPDVIPVIGCELPEQVLEIAGVFK